MHIRIPDIRIARNREQAAITPVPLSFTVDRIDFEEKLDTVSFPIERTVSKRKGTPFYLIAADAAAVSLEEIRMLAQEKAHVIDVLSNNNMQENEFDYAVRMADHSLSTKVGAERASYLSRLIAYDVAAYGPISILLEDSQNMEEIEINTPTSPISIYHAKYGRCSTNLRFNSEESFQHAINKMIYEADEELNEENPIIDAQIKDARVHAQLKPYSANGAMATIRIGCKRNLNLSALLKNGTITSDSLAYLWMAIDSKMNMVISGAPASGKTTLLTALLALVPRYKRVITIEEDVNELRSYPDISSIIPLYGSRFSGRVTISEQALNALRLRPDLLIIGEIRGNEARDLFSGTNLGIPFITTMHSNENGMAIIKRLTTRPMGVEPGAISALDISVYMRQEGMTSRKLSEICEYKWLSRAEEVRDYLEVNGSDGVKIDNIIENGILNPNALLTSKVIDAYSSRNQVARTKAMKEFSKRKKFIEEKLPDGSNTIDMIETIQNYAR